MQTIELNIHDDDLAKWKKFMNDFNMQAVELEVFIVTSATKAMMDSYVKDNEEVRAIEEVMENEEQEQEAPMLAPQIDLNKLTIDLNPTVSRKLQGLIAIVGDSCKEDICESISNLIDPIITERIAESLGIHGASVGIKMKASSNTNNTDAVYNTEMGDVSDEVDDTVDEDGDEEGVSDPFAQLGSGLSRHKIIPPPKPIKFKEGRIVPGSLKIRSRVSSGGQVQQLSSDMKPVSNKAKKERVTKPQKPVSRVKR